MVLNKKLLAIIGRLNPKIYDFVFPHGPVFSAGRLAAVLAEPIPYPSLPEDLGAAMAQSFASAQWTARRLGIAFDGEPDDWCPTGRPFKLPPGVVFPPQPDPEPYPWLPAFYLGFASRMAVLSEGADKADSAIFDKAVDHAVQQLERVVG